MQRAFSVLVAELAALALAAFILTAMETRDAHLLVDNQLLANYINGSEDHSIHPNCQILYCMYLLNSP
jgi:hypothetical protein